MTDSLLFSLIVAVASLAYALVLLRVFFKKSTGNDQSAVILKNASRATKMYFRRQDGALIPLIGLGFLLVWIFLGWSPASGFLVGSVLCLFFVRLFGSAIAHTSIRTTEVSRASFVRGLSFFWRSGFLSSFLVTNFASLILIVFYLLAGSTSALFGFAAGVSLLTSLIYLNNKIFPGATLLDKNNDFENPDHLKTGLGIINNNVVAVGAALELLAVQVVSLVVAMLLGRNLFADYANAIVFPLVLTALATIAALIGGWFVYFTKNKNLVFSFARGLFVEVVVFVLALWPLTRRLMGDLAVYSAADIYLSALIGLVVAILAVGIAAFWALSKKTKAITTVFSPAPFLTTGLALFVVLGIGVAYSLAGVYGITIAVVAAVSLVGVVMTVNAVATIANNVQALNALANPPVEDKENVEFSMAVNQATKTATRGYLAVALGLIIPILFILYRHQFIGLNLNLEFLLGDPRVVAGMILGGGFLYILSAWVSKRRHDLLAKAIIAPDGHLENPINTKKSEVLSDLDRAVTRGVKGFFQVDFWLVLMVGLTPLLIGLIFGPLVLGGGLVGAALLALFFSLSLVSDEKIEGDNNSAVAINSTVNFLLIIASLLALLFV